jgi:hypothetical protein
MKDILQIVLEMYSSFVDDKFFSFLGNMEEFRIQLGEYAENLASRKPENYDEQIREVDTILELTDEILENIMNAEIFLVNENLIEIMYAVQGFRFQAKVSIGKANII